MKNCVTVLWEQGPVEGRVEIAYGKLAGLKIIAGKGRSDGNCFSIASSGPCRLIVECAEAKMAPGACATRVTVDTQKNPFTFFLRDVNRDFPVFIAEYGVMVTDGDDRRSFADIAGVIRGKGLVSQLTTIANAPEESYEEACSKTRSLVCPTWLGLSRDMRFFHVGYLPEYGYLGYVEPVYHSTPQVLPGTGNKPLRVSFCVGPGASCRVDITRRLEEGVLPILHATQREDDVTYHFTSFATLEMQPVTAKNLRGSQWEAVYPNTVGHMLKPEEVAKIQGLMDAEMRGREEEVVCAMRIEAVNTGRTPRYAWFKAPHVHLFYHPADEKKAYSFQGEDGFSVVGKDLVYGVSRVNGAPMPNEEMAILLQPGETALLEMLVPHQPLSPARAKRLARLDIGKHLAACRKFWKTKLQQAASISLPEAAINERVQAGLLHLDIVSLGQEPDGNILTCVGVYAPIGSESAPMIQFFDSMGWHKLAERSLNFFLDRQREDGFIQNFGGYQLETGPALWSMGEHFRYTQDKAWVRRIQPKLLKACEYLLAWRERNKRDDLRGKSYGLLDGKVADPEDFFHSFMLNGLSYLGLKRVAEMLAEIDPAQSKRLSREAAAFRKDIRTAFYEAVGRSPAIPLSDGTWVPAPPPWTEYPGPVSLYADGGSWFTHGTFGGRDSLIGSLHLVISEVLDPDEIGTEFLFKSHQQLFTVKNAGISQPYYCRHDYIHLKRGEEKAFLKTYYNQLTSLQDRETYTFWEHYFGASQHKTHEEAWFLMQTRWMLYLEEGETLAFLRGIPRQWLEDGKKIELHDVATYFGPVSLKVESDLSNAVIRAQIRCQTKRQPKTITIRLPHPEGRKAVAVTGGRYDPVTETVCVTTGKGVMQVALNF